jgi:pimeloyl-ACP methyl ester carboxylesterase
VDLRGGPGGSLLQASVLEDRAKIYESLRQTRDIVMLDQRGTRFSNQLGCNPVALITFVGLNVPTSPYAGVLEPLRAQLRSRFPNVDENNLQTYVMENLCARVLENHGNDLSTYLAQRIMTNHPDRVRSVVLDSTLPVQVNKSALDVRAEEVSFLNLVKDCEADAACRAAYPNLTQRTNALLSKLDKAPILLAKPITPPANLLGASTPIDLITPAAFANLIDAMNARPSEIAPYLPLIVYELEQGKVTTFERVVTGTLVANAPTPPTVESSPESYRLQARDFEVKADKLLRARAAAAETSRPASRWVQQVQAAADTLPEAEKTLLLANFYGVGYLKTPRNRQTLLTFVSEEFKGDTAASLTAAVNAMSDIEVRHVYDVVSALTDSFVPIDKLITWGMYRSFDCRENAPDLTQVQASYNSRLMPLLGVGALKSAQKTADICSLWPVEPAPASERTPVNSSIPTLVLQGRYDTQTSSAMGVRVMEGLRNGTWVEFSSTGHAVIGFSQCAKDIGGAFVNNPARRPDTSCTASLFPKFLLPPAK